MDDTISRQQFADAFWKTEVEFRPSQIDEVMRILKQLPSTHAIKPEQKKAEWIFVKREESIKTLNGLTTWANNYKCPECDFTMSVVEDSWHFKFCPNCGLNMKGESNDTSTGTEFLSEHP